MQTYLLHCLSSEVRALEATVLRFTVSGLHFAGLVHLSSLIEFGLHFAGLVHLASGLGPDCKHVAFRASQQGISSLVQVLPIS